MESYNDGFKDIHVPVLRITVGHDIYIAGKIIPELLCAFEVKANWISACVPIRWYISMPQSSEKCSYLCTNHPSPRQKSCDILEFVHTIHFVH